MSWFCKFKHIWKPVKVFSDVRYNIEVWRGLECKRCQKRKLKRMYNGNVCDGGPLNQRAFDWANAKVIKQHPKITILSKLEG